MLLYSQDTPTGKLGAQQLFLDGRVVGLSGLPPELQEPALAERYTAVVDMLSDHHFPLGNGVALIR